MGVDFIGGLSALVEKQASRIDEELMAALPEALAETRRVCASVNIATTSAGINMDAVRMMGEVIKDTAERTRDAAAIGCAKLVVFANAVPDNPFMAGAFHGFGEGDAQRLLRAGFGAVPQPRNDELTSRIRHNLVMSISTLSLAPSMISVLSRGAQLIPTRSVLHSVFANRLRFYCDAILTGIANGLVLANFGAPSRNTCSTNTRFGPNVFRTKNEAPPDHCADYSGKPLS